MAAACCLHDGGGRKWKSRDEGEDEGRGEGEGWGQGGCQGWGWGEGQGSDQAVPFAPLRGSLRLHLPSAR